MREVNDVIIKNDLGIKVYQVNESRVNKMSEFATSETRSNISIKF